MIFYRFILIYISSKFGAKVEIRARADIREAVSIRMGILLSLIETLQANSFLLIKAELRQVYSLLFYQK